VAGTQGVVTATDEVGTADLVSVAVTGHQVVVSVMMMVAG
jgi:hypothetical protein